MLPDRDNEKDFWSFPVSVSSTWISDIQAVMCVVYFNQQRHACACILMVENNEKRLKITKKYFFIILRKIDKKYVKSMFLIMHTSGLHIKIT